MFANETKSSSNTVDQLGMEEINAIADKSEMQTKESDSTGESSVTIKKETASSALRKRSPGNLKRDKDLDEVDKNHEKRVLLESDSPNKTPTEEVFSDVFENIQMQLDMIEGLRGKPWTMEQKLEILR
ncbi:uncharacterized protein LOC122956750 [Acropora millepora]|nr:uncharacterized protein LOC122956750 [Acropora millepora]